MIRRKGNTREAKLAQKRQGKAEKNLHRKRDEIQKEREKRQSVQSFGHPKMTYDSETTVEPL